MQKKFAVHSRMFNSFALARPALCSAVAGIAVLALAATSTSDGPYPRPGSTERISFAGTTEANGGSVNPAVSADGRFVVFQSGANNLVPGDTNERADIFVYDRELAAMQRVSVSANGTQANDISAYPSISQDGAFVSFTSVATNLIPGVTGQQVYEKNLETGAIELVSRSTSGTPGNDTSLFSSVSADGRYVVFDSQAGNLVAGDTNASFDAFLFDRVTHTTERVSVSSAGAQANGLSGGPTVSANGRFVAFYSYASNLVPNDMNNTQDVFMRDRQTGTTERVSIGSDSAEANALSYAPAISSDGNTVAFQSLASNLVPNDFNGSADAFVRDRATGTTERISLTSEGGEASAFLDNSISADGRFVLFQCADPRIIMGGTPGALNMVVHDRLTGLTQPVSLTETGGFQNNYSALGKISAGGRHMVFDSLSTNFVAGDEAGFSDVFLRDYGQPLGVDDLIVSPNPNNVMLTGWATFSGQLLAATIDPEGDAVPGSAQLGGDLKRAAMIFRPERGDLLVRLDVSQLPGFREPAPVCALTFGACVGGASGAPGIFYALQLQSGVTPYQVTMTRQPSASVPAAAGTFALYRCDTQPCTKVSDLPGGYGTAASALIVSVPISLLGASEGSALTGLRALVTAGDSTISSAFTLDDVALPNVTLPARRIETGISPVGAPESQVDFTTTALLDGGNFSGTIDTGSLSGGAYQVWTRACLGAVCGPATSRSLTITAPLQLLSALSEKVHGAAGTFNVDLPLTGTPGIECRSGGASGEHQVVFTFTAPITVADATVNPGPSGTASLSLAPGSTPDQVIVDLSNVSNSQTLIMNLLGVSDGSTTIDVHVAMSVLLGDTNGDGSVNSADISQTKAQSGNTVASSNFREDVTTDGFLNSADISLVKSKSGTALPSP